MNTKQIKCILTGGCKFKSSDTESKCNDKEKNLHYYRNLLQMRKEIYSGIYLQTIRYSRLRLMYEQIFCSKFSNKDFC